MTTTLTISIISHNQAKLAINVLRNLANFCDKNIEIIFTSNVEENLPFTSSDFSTPIKIIKNSSPKGFGANHNAAFQQCNTDFFCILNPDIQLTSDPFTHLLKNFNDPNVGIVAPLIIDSANNVQDNARKFPTPWSILKRTLLRKREPDYSIKQTPLTVDWAAGMFMLFRSDLFKQLKGFDERYFMYCEDIDICARAQKLGYTVVLDPSVSVIHNAQRDSHKNWQYMKWHVSSLLRFFYKRYIVSF